MKLTKDEFKKLQLEWYEKLHELGFKDIERPKGEELVLVQSCNRHIDRLTREMKEEYFRLLSQMVLDEETVYRNDIDRHVLTRYAEGAKIKDIVLELKTLNMSRDRYSVRIIIRRYEMLWGFRVWTDKQLHKKK